MDSEREKFRVYCEKSGVMSSLTDILVKLYKLPQRPENAVDYIKEALDKNSANQLQVPILEDRIKELEDENENLKEQLRKLRPKEETLPPPES